MKELATLDPTQVHRYPIPQQSMTADLNADSHPLKWVLITILTSARTPPIIARLYRRWWPQAQFDCCVMAAPETDKAQVVKLVDTLASGASGLTAVEVQVLSWAPFYFHA